MLGNCQQIAALYYLTTSHSIRTAQGFFQGRLLSLLATNMLQRAWHGECGLGRPDLVEEPIKNSSLFHFVFESIQATASDSHHHRNRCCVSWCYYYGNDHTITSDDI